MMIPNSLLIDLKSTETEPLEIKKYEISIFNIIFSSMSHCIYFISIYHDKTNRIQVL